MQQGKPTLYAWFVFILAAGFLFYKYLVFITPAIIVPALIEKYSLSMTLLGFLVSAYFYSYLLMQVPAGVLIDRYGTRKMTCLALLISALGLFIFTQAHNWPLAFCGRLLIGAGAAFAITSYMKLMSAWFPTDYFPVMASFFGIACMAGAGTAEMPLAWLMVHLGITHTLWLCSSIGLVLALLFWLFIKDKQAEDQAQKPNKDHTFSFKKGLKILKDPVNLALIVYTGLSFTPLVVFAGLWGIPFVMHTYGYSTIPAASIVSFSFFGFIVGGLAADPLQKKIKSSRVLLTLGTLLALSLLILIIYGPPLSKWILTLCIFLFGFFSSTSLMGYGLAKHFNALKNMSTAIVLINIAGPLFCLITEPLMGKIIEAFGYLWGFGVLIFCLVLALACIYPLSPPDKA